MNIEKVFIASDHAGFSLKQQLISSLKEIPWQDLGPTNSDRVDYPDFANRVAQALKEHPDSIGILVCGSGQGVSMRANKFNHVRAALCWTTEVAQLSREHNNANVLCLGERLIEPKLCEKIVKVFLSTPFEGGRHATRVEKIHAPTN